MSSHGQVPLSTPAQRSAVSKYLIDHYASLLSFEERLAYKHLLGGKKIEDSSSPALQQMLRKIFQTEDPQALALLANGEEAFFERVTRRIMAERCNEVHWNLCPKCGALARTPRACLCPVCSHTWYEKRLKVAEG